MKRDYNIPLRSAFGKKVRYKKTPTAVRAVRAFLMKHMKVEEVKLGKNLNLHIWKNGIKNPPAKVSVTVEKKDNIAYAELKGIEYNEPTKEDIQATKEKAPKNKLEEAQQMLKGEKPKKEAKEKPAEKEEEKIEEKTESKPAPKKATKKVAKE